MTVALAKAFAPKVRVNCIAPGPFLTDVSTVWRENEAFRESLALKRFGEPERDRRHRALSGQRRLQLHDRAGDPRRWRQLLS